MFNTRRLFTRPEASICSERMGGPEQAGQGGRTYWPSFLRGESAEWILARLSEGDPLRLAERCARRLREKWVLLDPERVCLRALGVCAEAAAREAAPADLEAWVATKVDATIERLVDEDREAERTRPGELSEEEQKFELLTRSLLVEPGLVRTVSVAFNDLGPLPRRAFFELLIEGAEPLEVIERGPWNKEELHAAVLNALRVIGYDVTGKRPARKSEDRS